jgi:hypothetical protein
VGTYVFARATIDAEFGAILAGSSLATTSAAYITQGDGALATGSSLLGMWRAMGTQDVFAGIPANPPDPADGVFGATLWLRIS